MASFFAKPYFDLGILVLRLLAAGLLFSAHGFAKLTSIGKMINNFADPYGLGTEITFLFALLAEGFCTILVGIGLFTRLAVLPILITMLSAVIFVHTNDPFRVAELPLLFAFCFFAILITGPGRISVDWLMADKRRIRV